MKTNGNEPVSPVVVRRANTCTTGTQLLENTETFTGLTKREYFAAIAMRGMLVNGCQTKDAGISLNPKTIAYYAVNQAEELIKALNE